MLTRLADQRPRRGWSRARIVETSDILYFIQFPKKNTYKSKIINTWIRVCFRRYRYCHWRNWDWWFTVFLLLMSLQIGLAQGGARDSSRFYWYCCKQFQFPFINHYLPSRASRCPAPDATISHTTDRARLPRARLTVDEWP
jgi:hypothetical protein